MEVKIVNADPEYSDQDVLIELLKATAYKRDFVKERDYEKAAQYRTVEVKLLRVLRETTKYGSNPRIGALPGDKHY